MWIMDYPWCSLGLFLYLYASYEKVKYRLRRYIYSSTVSTSICIKGSFCWVPNVQATTFVIISDMPLILSVLWLAYSNTGIKWFFRSYYGPWQILSWGLAGLVQVLSKFHTKPSRLLLSIFAFCWGFCLTISWTCGIFNLCLSIYIKEFYCALFIIFLFWLDAWIGQFYFCIFLWQRFYNPTAKI